MVGGVETSCHTRLPSLNYAGSNVQPSVITHSLTLGMLFWYMNLIGLLVVMR
jgi:hypothetical protein